MRRNLKRLGLPQLIVAVLCAAAIKLFYSTASVSDLLWILAPTTYLVELVTGAAFEFETGAGYMNHDHSFLIAAACSGVNFMIAAFLMLTLGHLWKGRTSNAGWLFIPVSMLAAYISTILANTVRISTALKIRPVDPDLIWLNPDQFHRFEGIVIYFGFLLLLFVISERIGPDHVRSPREAAGLFRRSLLPLLIYYATTLGVPLANGAYRGGLVTTGFWEHSLFVVIIPILLIITLGALTFVNDQRTVLQVWRWR